MEDMTTIEWTDWASPAAAVAAAPRVAGVYMARTSDGNVVYVSRAGDRRGAGVAGRLHAYATGRTPDSGLIGKATDRALADPEFVRELSDRLEDGRPWTLRQLATAALRHLGIEIRSAATSHAVAIENQLIAAHRNLWNVRGVRSSEGPARTATMLRRDDASARVLDPSAISTEPPEMHPPRVIDKPIKSIPEELLSVARAGLITAGASQLEADAFARELDAQVCGDDYNHAAAALVALLRHQVGILVDGGTRTLPLDAALHNLGRCGVGPEKAARALILGAVAVGGCPDGIRPAWQHCQDHGHVTRGGRGADHPVRGVNSPSGARSLYNLLIGAKGAPGRVATEARGPVEHR